MSKNPPLTEDQIRQSAEAEARHAAAQASRNSQLDYMIAEQRQQQATAALEAIVGSEEDRFKAAASKIEASAHRTIEEQDRRAREVGEEISQLVISSRSIGDQIAAGSTAPVSPPHNCTRSSLWTPTRYLRSSRGSSATQTTGWRTRLSQPSRTE